MIEKLDSSNKEWPAFVAVCSSNAGFLPRAGKAFASLVHSGLHHVSKLLLRCRVRLVPPTDSDGFDVMKPEGAAAVWRDVRTRNSGAACSPLETGRDHELDMVRCWVVGQRLPRSSILHGVVNQGLVIQKRSNLKLFACKSFSKQQVASRLTRR